MKSQPAHSKVLPAFALLFILAVVALLAVACGGSGSHSNTITTSGSNVQPIVVNSGPAQGYANGVFTSVTVCVPSSSNCQTIDGILVDTGSFGLRLLSSAGGGALTLSLPQQTGSGGDPIGECGVFGSGSTWGPVATADITISGESANNLPVQVIDPTFASEPTACVDAGPTVNTLADLGANGLLGVGPLLQDCGTACAQGGSSNPGYYFVCAGTSCSVTTEGVSQQVQNPVGFFATDNNGVIVELSGVSAPTTSTGGSLVFGIGTQSNNGLAGATIFGINSDGNISTTYSGQSYPAFLDSGSNALYFLDTSNTGWAICGNSTSFPGFYCPSSQQNLSATSSSGSATESFSFGVGDAATFPTTDSVFPTLGGPFPGTFDWGLPFFYGRNVFSAIEGASTPGGTGPYWAF